MSVQDLTGNDMMAHLVDALNQGKDIGHYGRLVFVMVSRHFLSEEELIDYLRRDPGVSETEAKGLIQQVQDRNYSPPRRETILEWQQKQDFPICPDPDDPDACNVYKDLKFPESVYENIGEYHEQKAES